MINSVFFSADQDRKWFKKRVILMIIENTEHFGHYEANRTDIMKRKFSSTKIDSMISYASKHTQVIKSPTESCALLWIHKCLLLWTK